LTPTYIEQQAKSQAQQQQQGTNNKNETTIEAWLDRPYLFHYRGNGKKIPVSGSQVLHEMIQAMKDIYPNDSVVIENDHTTRDGYANELLKSKFCLVVRGDEPLRSRFNDAVAAGCVPVQINDGFEGRCELQLIYGNDTRTNVSDKCIISTLYDVRATKIEIEKDA
jgi:hypothetical protein